MSINLKTALVHDWFSSKFKGGAENVIEVIHEIISEESKIDPSIFSIFEDVSDKKNSWLYKKRINTTFIQKLPFSGSFLQYYLPLFPLAIEQLDLSKYDLILSTSHLAAKGVLTSPDQLHISYVHTPMRYAWDQMNIYLKDSKFRRIKLNPLIRLVLHYLRSWDQTSSIRVDKFIANSNFTARRIKKYWGREAKVIFPPVTTKFFNHKNPKSNFYLCVCRLVPNKRVDLLIKAFNILNFPLIVIGEGPEKNKLQKLARKNIKFLGYQNKDNLKKYFESCRAFVYAGIEDFGIAPVESMAAGSPVIAYKKAGLIDTVKCITEDNNGTGILFREQSVNCLIDTINWFEEKKIWTNIDPNNLKEWSEKYSLENFNKNFKKYLNECCDNFF